MTTQISFVNGFLTAEERADLVKSKGTPFIATEKTGELFLTFQNKDKIISIPVLLKLGQNGKQVIVAYNNLSPHEIPIDEILSDVKEHCVNRRSFTDLSRVTVLKAGG